MKYAVNFLLLLALVFSVSAFAEDKDDVNHRLEAAAADLNRLTNAPDAGIPQEILTGARCVAIVPSLVKGGFIFGAEGGRGVATCRVNGGRWSAPAFFTIAGGSWGAQIGVEDVNLVMLFMNHEGANHLLSADWKIGADAGVAAGPWGRNASANMAINASTSILTYSRSKGAFIGVNLNGANVHVDERAMRDFYGHNVNFRAVLEGRVPPPPAAHPFLADIRHNFHEAEASK
ncbi:MAG: lipid-binding SYLF domain-containing protein [Candidatus Korobacteraceae bacterium]